MMKNKDDFLKLLIACIEARGRSGAGYGFIEMAFNDAKQAEELLDRHTLHWPQHDQGAPTIPPPKLTEVPDRGHRCINCGLIITPNMPCHRCSRIE